MSSPRQLLAANHSLTGVPAAPRRFKVMAQGYLPNFAHADAPPTAPPPNPQWGPLFARAGTEPPSSDTQGIAANPPPASVEPSPLRASPEPPTSTLRPSGRWSPPRRTSIRPWWHRAFSRRNPRTAVQGELTLARVRVIRNDLADADLEIVNRTHPGRATSPFGLVRLNDHAHRLARCMRWLTHWIVPAMKSLRG